MIRELFVLFVLCTLSWSTFADDAKPMTAMLIVARAELPDANFKDSIVLAMNQLGPGPVGVIINRPTRIPVGRLFPELDRLARLDDKLYFGGPVGITSVSFLFRSETRREDAVEVLDGLYFSRDANLLRKLLGRDNPTEGLRIFVGFAAWARGQLENEIARGDWTLTPASAGAIFGNESEHPWPERELPGGVHRVRLYEDRIRPRARAVGEEKGVSCCYAKSDKYWLTDPQGTARGSFRSLGPVPLHGEDSHSAPAACGSDQPSGCCAPEMEAATAARATGCCATAD